MTTSPSLSLSELAAINDELAALVRAGVPLEATLGELGRDLPGRLGRATTQLADRIEGGASLPQALAAMPDAFPPMYRAAVEAGLSAGRLPVVLEDLSRAARRLAELRRTVSMAALYPLLVMAIAFSLFVLFLDKVLPQISAAFEGNSSAVIRGLMWLRGSLPYWAPVLPVVLTVAAFAWWYRMGKGRATLRWLPIAGTMLRDAKIAAFSETLSLLLDHDVPLPQALRLAGSAIGDGSISNSAEQLARHAAQGSVSASDADSGEIPPFFAWLIGTDQRKELLVPLLKETAEIYRRRAMRKSDWIRIYLPVLMTLAIGGVTVLVFTLSLFVPLTEMLYFYTTDNITAPHLLRTN